MSSYDRVDQFWEDTRFISPHYADKRWLANLSMCYLEKSGTNDWRLVYDIVQTLLVEPVLINDANGREVPNDTEPSSPGQ